MHRLKKIKKIEVKRQNTGEGESGE